MTRHIIPAIAILSVLILGSIAIAAPIHDAASKGNLAAVQKLVKASPANINLKDKTGATPLHFATAAGAKPVVEYLLANKADIEAQKTDGVRAVHVAAALGKLDILKLLVAKGAKLDLVDSKGRSPLSIAEEKSDKPMIEFIRSKLSKPADNEEMTRPVGPEIKRDEDPPMTTPVGPEVPNGEAHIGPGAPAAGSVHNNSAPDLADISQQTIQALMDGRYSDVTSRLDDKMRIMMTEDNLVRLRTGLNDLFGSFVKISNTKMSVVEGFDCVDLTCEFSKKSADLRIAFNKQGQIAGFWNMAQQ